jgi:hypothetical protein
MIDLLTYALTKKTSGSGSGNLTAPEVDLSDYALKSDLDIYAKKDELRAYMPFNSNWRTNSTIANFCYDIDHDDEAIEGMTFLGELRCSDFHNKGVTISNGEAVVEIIKENGIGGGKTIHIILTSGTTYPYRWEYTYWGKGNNQHGWIGFYPIVDDQIPASALTPEARTTFSHDEEKLILHSQTEDSEKMFKITVDDSGELTATEIVEE